MPDDERTLSDHESRIRGVERWMAENGGQRTAWWEAQHRWNGQIERKIDRMREQQVSTQLSLAKLLGAIAATSALTAAASKLLGFTQ